MATTPALSRGLVSSTQTKRENLRTNKTWLTCHISSASPTECDGNHEDESTMGPVTRPPSLYSADISNLERTYEAPVKSSSLLFHASSLMNTCTGSSQRWTPQAKQSEEFQICIYVVNRSLMKKEFPQGTISASALSLNSNLINHYANYPGLRQNDPFLTGGSNRGTAHVMASLQRKDRKAPKVQDLPKLR